MKSNLNILVFQPNFDQYKGAYYQHQFIKSLGNVHNIFKYGPHIENYDKEHTIKDVLMLCPFKVDIICFGAGWEIEDINIPEFDPHPNLQVFKTNIPRVMILNKEYKKLDKKFEFIQDNHIQMVFTVHHHYHQWQRRLRNESKFVHFPFAIDPKLFNDYGKQKHYDLGFSGRLHKQYSDIRSRIKNHLFLMWPIKRKKYWRNKIFWSEGRAFLRLPHGRSYAELVNKSKIWLSTPSAINIVGTRFYEIMASKSLLFCNRHNAYKGLFEDGQHCIMFDPDLNDFDEKLFYYLDHEDKRFEIVNRAYNHVMKNHTWEKRVEQFTQSIEELL